MRRLRWLELRLAFLASILSFMYPLLICVSSTISWAWLVLRGRPGAGINVVLGN